MHQANLPRIFSLYFYLSSSTCINYSFSFEASHSNWFQIHIWKQKKNSMKFCASKERMNAFIGVPYKILCCYLWFYWACQWKGSIIERSFFYLFTISMNHKYIYFIHKERAQTIEIRVEKLRMLSLLTSYWLLNWASYLQ
jgi:hypothetical protein